MNLLFLTLEKTSYMVCHTSQNKTNKFRVTIRRLLKRENSIVFLGIVQDEEGSAVYGTVFSDKKYMAMLSEI